MLVQQLRTKILPIITLLVLLIPASNLISQDIIISPNLKGGITKQLQSDTVFISDTLVTFDRNQVITLANKIQQVRDSLRYFKDIGYQQFVLINQLNTKISIYDSIIVNSNYRTDALKKQNDELNVIIQNMKPAWYDNKFLWFSFGIASTVTVIYLIK